MADDSKIEWTEATWNPIVGCTAVSPGCDHCYAAREASGRLSHLPLYAGLANRGVFTGEVRLVPERLTQPLRWTKPRRVFVNSMSDLFHKDVPDDFIAKVFAVMALAPRHIFQVLTKRHGRMRSLLSDPDFKVLVALAALEFDDVILSGPWPLPNVWLGVSVENQQWADIRIPALLDTPAAVRWLSMEPLLGSVDLRRSLARWQPGDDQPWTGDRLHTRDVLGWVVAGGESGPNARPMHPDWARSLRDQCAAAGVPFFFKQHGEWEPIGPLYPQGDDDPDPYDDAHMEAVHLEVIENRTVIELERDGYIAEGHQPGDERTWLMGRVGKKRAGRVLDGRTHDEYPAVTTC